MYELLLPPGIKRLENSSFGKMSNPFETLFPYLQPVVRYMLKVNKKHCTKNEVFHLLKKSLMENFIFCAVKLTQDP